MTSLSPAPGGRSAPPEGLRDGGRAAGLACWATPTPNPICDSAHLPRQDWALRRHRHVLGRRLSTGSCCPQYRRDGRSTNVALMCRPGCLYVAAAAADARHLGPGCCCGLVVTTCLWLRVAAPPCSVCAAGACQRRGRVGSAPWSQPVLTARVSLGATPQPCVGWCHRPYMVLMWGRCPSGVQRLCGAAPAPGRSGGPVGCHCPPGSRKASTNA